METKKYQIEDITPEEYRCAVGACQVIYEVLNEDKLVIVGKRADISELEGRINEDEAAVVIDKELIYKALRG